MVRKKYFIPDRGDIVWIDFNPQRGREQAKKRPAIVISPKIYNIKAGLALMCPITSKIKGYPFEVAVRDRKINGAVLCDQIRSLDWRARKVSLIQKANSATFIEVREKILLIIG